MKYSLIESATGRTSCHRRRAAKLVLLAVCFGAHTVASAVPFVHDERTDGELGVDGQQMFEFDVGANRVSGQVWFRAGLGIPVADWSFDSDHFYFLVPPGTTIRTIELSWTTDLEPATTLFDAGVNLLAGTWDPQEILTFHTVEYSFMGDSSGIQPFVEDLASPIEGEYFRLWMFTGSSVKARQGLWAGGTVEYRWVVTVAPMATEMPEPGTFALLGLGLAGLGAVRKRAQL